MRKLLALGVALGSVLGTFAASNAHAAGYGAAGCGLGSIVFGNKPGFVQVFAATTNGTFASQTFGITFGTSNCGDGAVAAGPKVFIEANKEALAKDMSRGSGETIQNLSAVAGCKDSAQVGTHLQRNFQTLAPTMQTPAFSDSVMQSLRSEKSLACGKLG
jgi:hypothetical protein